MKYFISLTLFLFASLILLGQAPQGLNFQTIVRDNAGKPLSTKNVTIKFSILKGSSSGTTVYSEEHHSLTNEFGLTNVLIGYGFPLSGRFDQVDWSSGSYFLKTEMDPNGGINFELTSVSTLLSVPYALYAEKTKLEAGPGIQIDGNKITNTGDPDPSDDLKAGSMVNGDLSGTLPSPRVIAIQGRPVQDINPLAQQALIWNGTQWVPGAVDSDPTNDLLINSNASGDLSGTYPNPKVAKLNGFPLSITSPDSGDVLVFSQGEWKHFPISTGPSNSEWKRIGNDIVLQDPINVKQIVTSNASLITQNRMISAKGSDSTYLSPVGLSMNKISGINTFSLLTTPESVMMNRNNSLLMGINAFGSNANYSEMEFWNLDPGNQSIRSFLNPYEIHFEMDQPDRGSHLFPDYFEIYRRSKESPLEYSGVEIVDSFMYFYSGGRDILGLESQTNFGGGVFTYDKSGKDRVVISWLSNDQTQPYFGLFSTKTNREVVELLGFNSTGELYLSNGNNGKLNIYAGSSSAGPSYPFLSVIGSNGDDYAGIYVNTFDQGVVFGDIKSFRMKDPEVQDQEIWYASIEGPEAAAYERGSATLINGEAFVPYSDHFKKVINSNTVTIQLTPGYADTYGIAIVEKLPNGFKVKELKNQNGNFSFDWEAKAVRTGFENYEVYHKKETLRQVHDQSTKGYSSNSSRTVINKNQSRRN
jgi:hypothetical protein